MWQIKELLRILILPTTHTNICITYKQWLKVELQDLLILLLGLNLNVLKSVLKQEKLPNAKELQQPMDNNLSLLVDVNQVHMALYLNKLTAYQISKLVKQF